MPRTLCPSTLRLGPTSLLTCSVPCLTHEDFLPICLAPHLTHVVTSLYPRPLLIRPVRTLYTPMALA